MQQTCDRAEKIVPKEDIIVVTRREFADIVMEQLPWLQPRQLVLEPVNRNTAPAAAVAANRIRINEGRETVMLILPADQLIINEQAFVEAAKGAEEYARTHDKVLVFGATPTRPEPGYGYIQVAPAHDDGDDTTTIGELSVIKSFVEKPDRDFAELFIQSGEFLWNTGIYMARVGVLLSQLDNLLPVVMRPEGDKEKIATIEEEHDFLTTNYCRYPNLSLDLAIMEKMKHRRVLHSNFGWADLGTWHGIYESVEKDSNENVVVNDKSEVIADNSRHNVIALPDGKLAIIANLDGYIIAEQDNTLLICPKGDTSSPIRKYLSIVENK